MKTFLFCLLNLLFFTLFSQTHPQIEEYWQAASHRQFDFWVGEWDVNLRIRQPDGVWKDQVQSTAHIYSILDGKAVLELCNENKKGEGIKGYSLRYFNEEKGKWELWLNWPGKNRSGSSSLEGNFRHGRGEFFSERPKNDSVTITSRYTFSDITPNSLRWDDAFSEDGGITWKQGNWIMEFSRKGENPPPFRSGEPLLTYDNGDRCDQSEFNFLNQWEGTWSGKMTAMQSDGRKSKTEAHLKIFKALDGCAILAFMESGENEDRILSFSLKTYNTYAGVLEEGTLDNQSRTDFEIGYGPLSDNEVSFVNRDRTWHRTWTFKKDQLDMKEYHTPGEDKILVRAASFKKK